MKATAAIAVNVFRESVRDKVLYNLVLFAILLIAASLLIGELTAGQDVKIIKDLGLTATSIFGLFIAVFIGIGLVSKEVERRSIYSLLAKPIDRWQLVIGKYAGLALTLAVNISVMAVAQYGVLAYMAMGVSSDAARAWDAPAVDPALLVATPLLSAALTFALFIVGHYTADLRNFQNVVGSTTVRAIARGLYWVLPNLAQFDVKASVVHGQRVPPGYVAIAVTYAAVYIALLLTISTAVFARRDFK